MEEWSREMTCDDDRDYAEEEYNRNYCDICGYSPCRSDNGHAEEFEYEFEKDLYRPGGINWE